MREFSLVDTPPAVEEAISFTPNSILISDNPFIAESKKLKKPVKNIEKLLTNEDSLYIGSYAAKLSRQIELILNKQLFWDYYLLKPNSLYVSNLFFRLCAGIIYRSTVLSKFIGIYKPERLNLYVTDAERYDSNAIYMPSRFSHPSRVLHELGFFKDIMCTVKSINYNIEKQPNDTSTKNILQRYLVYPKKLPFYMVISWVMMFFRNTPSIVVGQQNEALREILPRLAFSGYVYTKYNSLPNFKRSPANNNLFFKLQKPISNVLKPKIKFSLLENMKFTDEQADAVATVICGHVGGVLQETKDYMPELIKWFNNSFPKSTNLYLTNALKGLIGRQILELCREKKIKVVEFEHGVTAGISALADYKHKNYDPVAADYFLVSSNQAVSAVESAGRKRKGFAYAIGLAEQTRMIFNGTLQRIIARKRLDVKNNEKLLFHVSTSPYNANYRTGLFEPTDTHILTNDRIFVENIYSKIHYRVIFKQYPTKRYPYEPSYEKIFSYNDNVFFHHGEDFRYIRSAADIIVTMKPTSTLGWCIGTDKPIIWLDSKKFHPLSNSKLRKNFKDSFLFIDMDSYDWQLKFLNILNLEFEEINNIWKEKLKYRKKLYEQAISSHNGVIGSKVLTVLKNIE